MENWFLLLIAFSAIGYSCQKGEALPVVDQIHTNFGICAEPNLFTDDSGQTYLSWIMHENDTTFRLQFSTLGARGWSSPRDINSGSNWFVNWADFPSLIASANGKYLAAHWLEMRAEGTYDYDVRVSQSADGGESWSESFVVHTDGIAAEHGFVSLLPMDNGGFFAAWLDGRFTKGPEPSQNSNHSHGHGGAMTLRAATIDRYGNLLDESQLDGRVCDCCQTSSAMTSAGPIVAYRDRSDREVRDIAVIRKVGNEWTEPKTVYNDGWQIYGCPVNGPTIRASGSMVAVTWFTIRDSIPEVKVSFSADDGKNFETPVRIDLGDPLGRVDLQFVENDKVMVTWMEKVDDTAVIFGRLVQHQGLAGPHFTIAKTSLSRKSGFPRITTHENDVIAAWTNSDSLLHLKTARIRFN